MKRLIFLFAFGIMSLVSFGQESLDDARKKLNMHHYLCNCCIDFHYGTPFNKDNKNLIYAVPIKIYNNANMEIYDSELHYDANSSEKLDTLEQIGDIWTNTNEYCLYMNYYRRQNYIAKTFKYGYIDDWSWSTNSVNGINFNFKYINTNQKTIKYIDIYFIIKNDVNDICRILYNNGSNTCHLRGVGPIESYESGTYNWDAIYYTTADASTLHFTKIVLTFMDNTKYTLVKEIAYKYYPFDK